MENGRHEIVLSARQAGQIAALDAGRFGILELENVFAVDGAGRVEKLVGDVTEDGGTARGDAAFGNKDQELGEKLVNVNGGLELGELGEKFGGKIGPIAFGLLVRGTDGGTRREMLKTKTKMGIGGVFAAAFVVGETMLATALLRCSG